jgi:DNA-binding NarL/FixJ family response regulator
MEKVQVFVVSQQFLFSQGIEIALVHEDDIEISGATHTQNGVFQAIDTMPPDVILLDIDGDSEDGLMLARKIKQRLSSIAVVIFTSNPSDVQLFQALKSQAAAYLNKEISLEQLVSIIRRVARGEHPINESLTTRPQIAEQVLQQFQELSWRNESEQFISPLTARESEILEYIAQGYLNKQIAIALNISEQTIKNHVTSILRKLNANARTEAVVIAIKQGLISLN